MDSPGVYDSFLKLLKKARERNWRPVKVKIIQITHFGYISFNYNRCNSWL